MTQEETGKTPRRLYAFAEIWSRKSDALLEFDFRDLGQDPPSLEPLEPPIVEDLPVPDELLEEIAGRFEVVDLRDPTRRHPQTTREAPISEDLEPGSSYGGKHG